MFKRTVEIADEILVSDVAAQVGTDVQNILNRLKKSELKTDWSGEPITRESAARRVVEEIKANQQYTNRRFQAVADYRQARAEERQPFHERVFKEEVARRRNERQSAYEREGPPGDYAWQSQDVQRVLDPMQMAIVYQRVRQRMAEFDRATLTPEQVLERFDKENGE